MTRLPIPRSDIGKDLGWQIRNAPTISDVHALLATGRSFQRATSRTVNRWNRDAQQRRIAQLKKGPR